MKPLDKQALQIYPGDGMISISVKKYESLLADRKTLRALEAGGVDNWEGYSFCFEDEEDDDED